MCLLQRCNMTLDNQSDLTSLADLDREEQSARISHLRFSIRGYLDD